MVKIIYIVLPLFFFMIVNVYVAEATQPDRILLTMPSILASPYIKKAPLPRDCYGVVPCQIHHELIV